MTSVVHSEQGPKGRWSPVAERKTDLAGAPGCGEAMTRNEVNGLTIAAEAPYAG
ncbi:MAG TPA: hypothetical protein VHC18_18025 [Amycolatopsis sp.]|nr:hypothetical protein [Amycolatopsis sp.]